MSPGLAVISLGVKTNDLFTVGDPTTMIMIFPAAVEFAVAVSMERGVAIAILIQDHTYHLLQEKESLPLVRPGELLERNACFHRIVRWNEFYQ